MKRLVTIGAIMTIVLAFALWGLWFANSTREEFDGLIAEAERYCDTEDAAGLLRHAEQMEKQWEHRQLVLSLYSRHDELEKMATHITTLKGCAETEAFDSARIALEQMLFITEHIYSREVPNLNNLL